jgi:dolichol-phosphate mannosyltransferase
VNAAPGPIEIVLPVHNEAASIEATLREFHRVAAGQGLPVRFLACEDGSTDGTREILKSLESELPLVARCDASRLGYSRAVVLGLRAATAPLVGFVDSDGQCDPTDLARLAAALPGQDVVFGFRRPRADPAVRRLMSAAFGVPFRLLFRVRRIDPSCPYLLIRREALGEVLRGSPGILPQGFWWEFSARAQAAGLRIAEIPVRHRPRVAGASQVYRPGRIPRIAAEHLLGLLALRRDIGGLRASSRVIGPGDRPRGRPAGALSPEHHGRGPGQGG